MDDNIDEIHLLESSNSDETGTYLKKKLSNIGFSLLLIFPTTSMLYIDLRLCYTSNSLSSIEFGEIGCLLFQSHHIFN